MKSTENIELHKERVAAVIRLEKKAKAKKIVAHSIKQPSTKAYVATCKKNEREYIRESARYADAYLSAADYYVE